MFFLASQFVYIVGESGFNTITIYDNKNACICLRHFNE